MKQKKFSSFILLGKIKLRCSDNQVHYYHLLMKIFALSRIQGRKHTVATEENMESD